MEQGQSATGRTQLLAAASDPATKAGESCRMRADFLEEIIQMECTIGLRNIEIQKVEVC